MTQLDEVENEFNSIFDKLEEAYVLAGSLRDTFSSVGNDQEQKNDLKDYCNKIRGAIYEIQKYKNSFRREIFSINK